MRTSGDTSRATQVTAVSLWHKTHFPPAVLRVRESSESRRHPVFLAHTSADGKNGCRKFWTKGDHSHHKDAQPGSGGPDHRGSEPAVDHKGAESAPVRCLPDQTGEFTQRAAELFAAVLWNVMRVKRSCQPFPRSRACICARSHETSAACLRVPWARARSHVIFFCLINKLNCDWHTCSEHVFLSVCCFGISL